MTIAWGEITDAELAAGVIPSAVLFSKLVNNPRAVMYGDSSVPYSKKILAEECLNPTTGAFNDFLLSDGLGGIVVGQISFPSLMVVAAPIVSNGTSSPFPVTGIYTVMLWGNGGAGATAPAAYGEKNGGGPGGFAKGYIHAKSTDQITVGGLAAGQAAYVFDVGGAWRMDAGPGQEGSTVAGLNNAIGGTASLSGFIEGEALQGRGTYGWGHGMPPSGLNVADYGRGGEYNGAGNLGAVLIARGVF